MKKRVGYGNAARGILVVALAFCISGCVAAAVAGAAGAAGVGTAMYVEGEQSQVHRAGLDRTWRATLTALNRMHMPVETSSHDSLGGTIDAKRADGTAVTIKEEPVEGGNTRVKIRVGTLGNQGESAAIQQEIDRALRA